MIISPCINICKLDPKTMNFYGCARSNEEKIKLKEVETTDEWKINNIKEIIDRMTESQLQNFNESYNFKKENGMSLTKYKKINEQK
tara:strand:+ start:120 stop:377 length:258 start_codon:yes stop_codon:yes gene_type:complete